MKRAVTESSEGSPSERAGRRIMEVVRRPWLDLYTGSGLLAQRITSSADLSALDDDGDDDSRLPIDIWVLIGCAFGLEAFQGVVNLGQTCHMLRAIARHTDIWKRFCGLAFSLPGYLSCESQLRLYRFSYREMFKRRLRLRFDGLYYLTSTRLLHGCAPWTAAHCAHLSMRSSIRESIASCACLCVVTADRRAVSLCAV